ncbi:DUF11 domain-containing protein [Hymenobacter sp. BT559]|uniref:Ig-like domain-containing protein n=1 Tax=Hymenobacter sp. BT559 TaxID=2795729 RepID=UPI0018EBF50B|nr:DUF11 domain-containing protein [Hymenobacter sp. BT559]MBJ6143212.1 hypothetical protein [Hymenobacter sp. BT559]
MPTALKSKRWTLWVLALVLGKPATGWAQRYVGGNLVTNGTFSSQPTGTNIAAGTDLGNWKSSRTYSGSGVDAAENQPASQTGTATYRTGSALLQRPFPGDAANGITTSDTWLLYNGNLGVSNSTTTATIVSSFIWYQDIQIVAGGSYVFSYYASNALNPTLSGKALPTVNFRVRNAASNANLANFGGTTFTEEATANGQVDTWRRVQYAISSANTTTYTTSAGTTTLRFVLSDGSTTAAVDGGDVALTGISLRRINQIPRGQQTAPTVFGRQGIVSLPTLRADDPDPDGAVVSYKIKVLPPASQGVLLLNGSPVRANQVLTTAEAAALSFNPNQNFSGNALFTYTATDNVGDESLDLNYGIPVDANSCNTQSVFSFASRSLAENWTSAQSVTVDGITISSAYTAPSLATSTVSLLVADETGNDPGAAQPGKGIVWTADYGDDATQAAANRQSSIKFSFTDAASGTTRFLNNFTLVVGDIDRGSAANTTPSGFIDRVTFSGTKADGTIVTLTAADVALAPSNTFANNAVTGSNPSGSPAGNIVLAFPVPVKDVTATYSSAEAVSDPASQKVTILNLSWCGEADLATTISGPATAAAGQTVFYYATTTNTGPRTTSSASTTITLPGKPAANTVNVPNGTYDASTGIVTFNTTTLAPGNSTVNYVSFVMPAGVTSFTGVAKSSALEIDNTASNNNGSAANANVTTTVGATGAAGTALGCPTTPGKDGTVTSLTAAPNTYFLPAANAAAGQKSISLSATTLSGTGAANVGTALAPGDLVLIVQMQGAVITSANDDTYGDGVAGPSANGSTPGATFTAGRYEYGVVAATSATITPGTAGTLTLRDNLTYTYTQADASATQGQQRYQIIRIPQYIALTLGSNLAPPAWNGQLGGVLALDVAGPLNFNGKTLDASGAGFRGGAGRVLGGTAGLNSTDYRTDNTSNGGKGEGTAGTPNFVATYSASGAAGTLVTTGSSYPNGDNGRGAPGTAGGGGTDGQPTVNDQNTGGGGGANGGRGGRGGNAWASNLAVGGEPGAAFPLASSSRLVLGGGGGAGVTNNGTGNDGAGAAYDGLASSGAPGGGIVLVRTGSVTGAGSIVANGYNADNSVANDGSGGGGAGGSILLTAQNPNTLGSISLTAMGGTGGTNSGGGVAHGPGGGGGGGFIVTNGPAASASAVAGTNGITFGSVAFGAESGTVGVGNPAISNSIAGSAANASCVADVASVITGPATAVASTATANSTVNLNVTFSNYGAIPATGVAARVSLPATLTNIVAPGATITGGITQPYILTYSSLTSLAVGASQSYSLSYSVPLAGGSANVKADANISTTSPEPYTANNPSSITTNIGNYADVTTTITGPASVNPGLATSDFTVNFTNNGPATAQGITQSVTLPSGASITPAQLSALQAKYASAPVTISYVANTRVLSFTPTTGNNTLAAGISNSYSFPITAGATPGAASITSTVGTSSVQTTTGATGPGALPDAATYNFGVAPLADMVASITNNGTATVVAGGTGTFVATFTNNGPSAADNVTPTVQLPAGLSNVTFSSGLGGTYNATTGLVTYASTGTLASGSNLTSTISFTMPGSQVVAAASVNTTSNEGTNTANNTATAAIGSSSNFDVTTTISGPTSAAPGTSVTLSVLTQNAGPGVAPSTTQTVVLPGVFTSLYVSNGGTYSNNGTNTTVTFPAVTGLASGANVNNSITLTMPATALNNITASVAAAGETNSLSNTATTSVSAATATAGNVNLYTTISAALAETPTTALTGPVAPGTALQLNIATGNYGPTAAANSVTRVALPAGLSGVVVSNDGTYNATTGVVTFSPVGNLAQGASLSYTIQLPAPASGPLVPVVSITSASAETVVADNVASTKVDIYALTDMTTSISGSTAPTVGQPATYAVTTTNNGPTQAAGVVQTVQLPAGLSSVALTNANGTAIALPAGAYNATTGLLTLPTAAVASTQAAGASVLTYVTFAAPASTGFPVTAAVSTTSQETNATNNAASITTTPAPTADVNVALSGPSTTAQGNLVTYTVATTNAGSSVNPSSTTTVQLPSGLSNVQVSGGGSYNSSTGVVTFPALTDQAVGAAGAVSNTISFVAPTTTPLTVTAQVAVTPAGNDPNLNNNSATVNTTVNSSNTNLLDESTTIAATVGGAAISAANPVIAGGSVTFTATAANASTSSAAASNVVLRLQLPAGLNPADVVLSNGSYDPATGVATFNTLGSQAVGVSNNFTATINNVPGNTTSLAATSYVSTTNSDSNPNNNVATVTLPFAPRADVTTTLSGPSTIAPNSSATYFVTTRNVGPSAASAVNTTVQLPIGLVGVIVSGGSYDANTGLVTFPTVASLPGYSGTAAANAAAQAVQYTITLTAPSTITSSVGYTLTSTVSTATTELATQAPNTASLTTTAANQPPVASNIVNSLQTPEGNTAQQAPISPLQATDPDGSVSSYTLTSLPTSGTLFYNSSGSTYTAITSANLLGGTSQLNLAPSQAQTLKYTPAAGFAGNAFFNYLATDNGAPALASAPALYTIPVGADNAAVYANTPVKASTAAYAANDVISFVADNNGAVYNTSSQLYNTASGTLQSGAASGVAAASSTGVFTSSQYNNITNLSQLGLVLNAATGQIQVQTPSSLLAGSYTLNITTTDQYGGLTTQPVTFTIGGTPLPVVLVEFGARAVQQRDALLSWTTASEVNSAYFEVERSFDGTTFVAIGRVAAQGTKAAASAYTLTDAGVAAKATGPVYYRLHQVDLDGTATYSPQRTVSFPKVATVSLSVYPNPVADRTTLDLSQLPTAATFQVQLLDATGRTVRTWALGGGQPQLLELAGLASGSYLLVVAGTQPDGSPLRQALRLTKE